MESNNNDENATPVVFHDDPAVNAGLTVVNEKAAFYRLAHAILTGKFDQNFAQWKASQAIDRKATENLPDMIDIMEWMFTSATTNDLFLFQDRLNDLMNTLLAELFGRYAEKDVRQMLPEGMTKSDLSTVRKELITTLDGIVQMGKSGILNSYCGDPANIEKLPEVGKRTPAGYWNFPDAPRAEDGETVRVIHEAINNFRGHNTNVKLVIDGSIPSDHPEKLGDACELYFDGKTAKQVGELFRTWSVDYYVNGNDEPKTVLVRNGHKYNWTTSTVD